MCKNRSNNAMYEGSRHTLRTCAPHHHQPIIITKLSTDKETCEINNRGYLGNNCDASAFARESSR